MDLYAPGVSIKSDWLSGGTNTISGTSMASPHVAGVAALLKGDWGEQPSSTIAYWILNATTPLFAVLVAHYLTHDEKMSPLRVGGVIIGFGGVVIMIGPDALAGSAANVGDIAADGRIELGRLFLDDTLDYPQLRLDQLEREGWAGLEEARRFHEAARQLVKYFTRP